MSTSAIQVGLVEDVLPELPDCSIDAILSDPPYGLSFMGAAWDRGVPSSEVWKQALRVLKPGGYIAAFGGTRTFHRLAAAIEDGGFEIRDCLAWMYGQGFPKSANVGKLIDKARGVERQQVVDERWLQRYPNGPGGNKNPSSIGLQKDGSSSLARGIVMRSVPGTPESAAFDGHKTCLKPAWEPVTLAMRPTEGGYAENALKWGVGGLAVGASAIEYASEEDRPEPVFAGRKGVQNGTVYGESGDYFSTVNEDGRYPPNVILDEESAALLDQQSGTLKSSKSPIIRTAPSLMRSMEGRTDRPAVVPNGRPYGDTGGASRFFYKAKAAPGERNKGAEDLLWRRVGDDLEPVTREQYEKLEPGSRAQGNPHPTVKPIDVGRWLAGLLLPPETGRRRVILVPYSGSGSEMIGALRAGWPEVYGITDKESHARIAQARIRSAGFDCEVSL